MAPSDTRLAQALINLLADVRWEGVALAAGLLAKKGGAGSAQVAAAIHKYDRHTKKEALRLATEDLGRLPLEDILARREKLSSAANPITKLFPGFIAEERFRELLAPLKKSIPGIEVVDVRAKRSLADFRLEQGGLYLPINVKVASTLFRMAAELVGLPPDDCLPIPAYKAINAAKAEPHLVYAITVDYALLAKIDGLLAGRLSPDEKLVWELLGSHKGKGVRDAEDAFVYGVVTRNWVAIRAKIDHPPFVILSAKRALAVLGENYSRVPGLGVRAFGSTASAEANVHIEISKETIPWSDLVARLQASGIAGVHGEINATKRATVPAPTI